MLGPGRDDRRTMAQSGDFMKIIAVAGGSGMGKTIFTKMLGERLPKSVVLPMDQYYFDKPDDIPAEKYDFDSPQALDFRLFHKALNELAAGNPVRMPQFDYVPAKRTKEYVKIVPGDYLIIEGLYVLMHASIRSMLSYSFFLESPPDVTVCRRCLRDMSEHGLSAQYSIQQYLTFVRPAYLTHVLPTKQFAKLVVSNGGNSRLDLFLDDFLKKFPL